MIQESRTSVRTALTSVVAAAALVSVMAAPSLASAPTGSVDLNSASVEQLIELPGIGPSKAAAIVEERNKSPFSSVEDLDRVKGIGPALIANLRDRVAVSSGGED